MEELVNAADTYLVKDIQADGRPQIPIQPIFTSLMALDFAQLTGPMAASGRAMGQRQARYG
jgi:hypothetical protein